MTQAPEKGAPNGHDSIAAVRASAPAAVAVPDSALQPCQYPYLDAFAARARLVEGSRQSEVDVYQLSFGFRLGLRTGRALELELRKGARGRAVAQLLRQMADSLDSWADDCQREATDPRDAPANDAARAVDNPAQEGQTPPLVAAVAGALSPSVPSEPVPAVRWCTTCAAAAGDRPRARCPGCADIAQAHARRFGTPAPCLGAAWYPGSNKRAMCTRCNLPAESHARA